MQTCGCEWIVDARACDPARLADPEVLRALFNHLIELLDLHPVAPAQWHCFPASPVGPGGITGLTLLAESHITVHTFPEHGSLCLNVFCCRERPDWDAAIVLAPFVAAPGFSVGVRRIERQIGSTTADGLRTSDSGPATSDRFQSAVRSAQSAVRKRSR